MYNSKKHIIAVDIGGTNIEGGMVDPETKAQIGATISRPTFDRRLPEAIPEDEKRGYADEATKHTIELISRLIGPPKDIAYQVGISSPGIISLDGEILTGVIFGNYALRQAIKDGLESRGINADVHVENDGNCGAYCHGEGQTLMLGTNVGSALNVNGELIGRNTEKKQVYCIFDEAGYAIRLDRDTSWELFRDYVSGDMFNPFFDNLSAENPDSPGLVRLEQLLGGTAAPRIFRLVYGRPDASLDARLLHDIADGAVNFTAELAWEIEGRMLGYAVARLQAGVEDREKRQQYKIPDGYRPNLFHIGGKVALALHHMLPFAEKSAKHYGAHDFELRESSYPNPNIIGAAIAYKIANPAR